MLSHDEIRHIAELARIRLSDEETEKYRHDLSQVLDFFKELESVDTSGVVLGGMITGKENAWREDRVSEPDPDERRSIIDRFPSRKDDALRVKSVF